MIQKWASQWTTLLQRRDYLEGIQLLWEWIRTTHKPSWSPMFHHRHTQTVAPCHVDNLYSKLKSQSTMILRWSFWPFISYFLFLYDRCTDEDTSGVPLLLFFRESSPWNPGHITWYRGGSREGSPGERELPGDQHSEFLEIQKFWWSGTKLYSTGQYNPPWVVLK